MSATAEANDAIFSPQRLCLLASLFACFHLQLTAGSGIGLAPALCEAVQALLARLQEQVAAATTADPLAGMPLPARCHGLLQLLLEVTWQVGPLLVLFWCCQAVQSCWSITG